MATKIPHSELDQDFYLPADLFFKENRKVALTYDDVTLATLYSEILPRDTNLQSKLADGLELNIPIVSSDMDTVTESDMAIAMALNGGLGLIHYNMTEQEQVHQVSQVKHHVHGLIQDPMTVTPEQLIGDVLALVEEKRFQFRTFPVVDDRRKLLGLLPGHVVKPRYASRRISEVLTPRPQVQTISKKELGRDPIQRADRFFSEHPGINKLLVVDEADCLYGLFTISDVERITQEKASQFKPARDDRWRLLCGR